MSLSNPQPPASRQFLCMTFCLGAIALATGCGSEEYERRLGETVKYFDYLDKINQSLSPTAWSEWGVELRVPRQFIMLPAPPKPEEPAEGEAAPEANSTAESEPIAVVDPRQPDFVDVDLPGLVAAWQAPVDVSSGDEAYRSAAYLYVFSNHQRFLGFEQSDQTPPPGEFAEDFSEALAQGLHVPSPISTDATFGGGDGPQWEKAENFYPPTVGYFPKKKFGESTISVASGINERPTRITLYQHHAGDIQVILMLAVPQGVDVRERIDERMGYALETMNISSEKPSLRKPAAGGGVSVF